MSMSTPPRSIKWHFFLERKVLFATNFCSTKKSTWINLNMQLVWNQNTHWNRSIIRIVAWSHRTHTRNTKLSSTIHTNVNWMKAKQKNCILFLIGLLPSIIIINSFELSLSTNKNKKEKHRTLTQLVGRESERAKIAYIIMMCWCVSKVCVCFYLYKSTKFMKYLIFYTRSIRFTIDQ